MSIQEGPLEALARLRKIQRLQDEYPTFGPFLEDMMRILGFKTSDVQKDIGAYLEHGPDYLMIQAQRGQAKTTITAIYAIWYLIHHPAGRVLIVSAGGTQANEISTLIVRLIMMVKIFEAMRPDKSQGDRTSVEHFDLHYSIKGVEKSPSVACMGVNSNIQGKRADLLIADDVESSKNSKTPLNREDLAHITKDFTSINSTGRIVYLGTPQSVDSIYNDLPGRGFQIRIWPGRYPNAAQMEYYGTSLAPMIRQAVERDPSLSSGYGLTGDLGAAVDPVILPDEQLVKKELDQGQAYFQLQHMLLTQLTDAMRFPLKTQNLVVLRMGNERYPMEVIRAYGQTENFGVNGKVYKISRPHSVSAETGKLQSKIMYIDPAGGGLNADETAYAVGGLLNSNVFLEAVGGVPGGYDNHQLQMIADLVVKYKPTLVKIEKNLGFGAYRVVVEPVIRAACEKAGVPIPGFEDDLVTGQKELRIIATLEPVMGRGALVINEAILTEEAASIAHYDLRIRDTYSFLFQLSKLTRDRDSLIHDDRIDAVEGLVRHYSAALAVDQNKAIKASAKREYDALIKNPLGLPSHVLKQTAPKNLFQNRIRKL